MRRIAVALVLLVLGATPAGALAAERYVALGDSYSSGTGTRTYFDAACQRSVHAYPSLIGAQRPNTELVFAACAGATTDDVLAKQVPSLTGDTRWVTLTIGGNDIDFSRVLGECGKPAPIGDCNAAIDRAQAIMRDRLPGQLDKVYGAIKGHAAGATVIVLSYPELFMGVDCNAGTFFSADEMRRLNEAADLLRDVTQARVAAAGPNFRFVDAVGPFRGHAVCSPQAWLNGFSNPRGESFHPNTAGHSAGYAPLVRAVMG